MKKLFLFLSLMLVALVACEKTPQNQNDGVTELNILTEQPIMIDYQGSQVIISYEISNPDPESTLHVLCSAEWVKDLQGKNGVVAFNADRNNASEERQANILFSYGDIVETVVVTQGARPEGTVDYDVKATVFGGEYYGMDANDNYNYYVQVGTGEINEYNDAPDAVYYYFDIYAKYRGGEHPILPNGTYTFDSRNSKDIGTFTAEYSKAHINNKYGVADIEFVIVSGEATVTDNKFEAQLTMLDGTIHHVVYEGELYVPYMVDGTPEVATTLTEDYTFDHSGATLRLFYYGDYYDCGKDLWSVHLMESTNPINGDYVMIDIITDGLNEGASKENVEGTYTACSDLDIKPNSFITGVIEGEKYIYSWRLICEEDYIINGNGRVPMSDGEIKIEFDGNNFVVNFDCVDDADNKFAGKFEGAAIEIYDRSK